MPRRAEMIEFFEHFRLKLFSRAQARVPKPLPKLPPSADPADTSDTSRDPRYAERQARLAPYKNA